MASHHHLRERARTFAAIAATACGHDVVCDIPSASRYWVNVILGRSHEWFQAIRTAVAEHFEDLSPFA